MSSPTCSWHFYGDSTASDSLLAAMLGALRLGFTTKQWCIDGGPNFWNYEDRSMRCSRGHTMGAILRRPSHPWFTSQPCETIDLRFTRNPRAAILLVNYGLHANNATEYDSLLKRELEPFLEIYNSSRVLWRETTPQHFENPDGSGLYSSRQRSRACKPIFNVTLANWRNRYFEQWLQARTSKYYRGLRKVPLFQALISRHDLHHDGDCTHFLYSPFTWEYLWQGVAHSIGVSMT
eukprot:gb/GFBE01040607.1/.p1 GENE.gb/GFBE01040607.1/~~gb/GFBE01040607.1/.p1  ORF type:complete len:235 (+),score=11.14 gb/GFBE01040607.1/:1-705(+)